MVAQLRVAALALLLLAGSGATTMASSPFVGQGADGNPHGWDRQRRCDHTDYDPPCGPCEGVGGKAYGDKNEEITLAACSVVANASAVDPASIVRPVWATRFSRPQTEILIGKKTDPFCFQAFPSNDSVGELCYREDTGVQSYDMEKTKALRLDLKVKSVVGQLDSTVIHQGPNMWIINHFPWYALGIHQCICTQPREGGDLSTKPVYPVQYNFLDQFFYIGRERLAVEYIDETMELEHFAFGPHHVWSTPEDGRIVRMWQPFNGLQVFPEGTGPNEVDDSLFAEIPPALCKKGGAVFRIKCDDDGYYKPPKDKVAAAGSADGDAAAHAELLQHVGSDTSEDAAPANAAELHRAHTMMPGKSYRAPDFERMSTVLNGWLQKGKAPTKPCEHWTAEELQKLQAMLYLARDSTFDTVYQEVSDNRRMRHAVDDLQATWDQLNALVEEADDPAIAAMHRDGHCHEAAMWYVHHLTEDVKQLLADANIEIPLLSLAPHPPPADDASDGHKAVHGAYVEKVSCASCHSDVSPHGFMRTTQAPSSTTAAAHAAAVQQAHAGVAEML